MKKLFLLFLVSALNSQAQTGNIITVNVENDAVTRFLKEVKYTSTKDASQVKAYNVAPPANRTIPRPALIAIPDNDAEDLLLTYADNAAYSEGVHTKHIDKGTKEFQLYNLAPRRVYHYKVEADGKTLASGEIHTEGQVRMIYVPGAHNIRDLGGWPTADGKWIKYGKLFRGGELNGAHSVDSAGLAILTDDLEIQAEIDMRAFYDEGKGISAFGFTTNQWGNSSKPPYYYTSDSGQLLEHLWDPTYKRKWKREFDFIVNNFIRERNVYFHCVRGADRTGYLALLLEGLLGVDYDNMIKDYELTHFYNGNVKETIDPVVDYIMQLEGATLQEKFNTFFVDTLGVYQDNVDYFRKEMLEEDKLTTAINTVHTASTKQAPGSAAVSSGRSEGPAAFDLWGRKATTPRHKGIVIETAPDGTVRKRIK